MQQYRPASLLWLGARGDYFIMLSLLSGPECAVQSTAQPDRIELIEILRHRDDLGTDFFGHATRQLLRKARRVLSAGERPGRTALWRRHQLREFASIVQCHADARRGRKLVARSLNLVVKFNGG